MDGVQALVLALLVFAMVSVDGAALQAKVAG
jgi:hypothetical protein